MVVFDQRVRLSERADMTNHTQPRGEVARLCRRQAAGVLQWFAAGCQEENRPVWVHIHCPRGKQHMFRQPLAKNPDASKTKLLKGSTDHNGTTHHRALTTLHSSFTLRCSYSPIISDEMKRTFQASPVFEVFALEVLTETDLLQLDTRCACCHRYIWSEKMNGTRDMQWTNQFKCSWRFMSEILNICILFQNVHEPHTARRPSRRQSQVIWIN